jgi:Mg-chelatase subunit ChlD
MKFMKKVLLILLCTVFNQIEAQPSLFAEETAYDFGTIEAKVYQINTDFIISNTGDKMLYILRADADQKIKLKVSKRQLAAGDTALVQIYYFPDANGSFNEKIELITNAQASGFQLKIKGKIKNYTPDDKQACFNFQSPIRKKKNEPVGIVKAKPTPSEIEESERLNKAIVAREKEEAENNKRHKPLAEILKEQPAKKDSTKEAPTIVQNSTKKPEKPASPENKKEESKKPIANKSTVFSNHQSNNLIFLLDVSSSMRDSTKLPYLKIAINELLDNVREQDKITIITYSDSTKILGEAVNQSLATDLKAKLKPIKAKGVTKGKEAILFAARQAVKHYIANGNNEIILASDGEFKFFDENYTQLKNITENKSIKISTIFFGDDFKAQMKMRKISLKGSGFYIKISNRSEATSELLEKVKAHSKLF